MMVTPDLIVAKAALSATLQHPDPNALNHGDVASFLELLDNTLDECSCPNVQKCKDWVVANVVPSSRRVLTLGKYLVALSESMDVEVDRPSVRKRRLHVLFIVSDVLHHVVTRHRNHELARSWDSHLPAMVASASTFEKCPKHLTKVGNLISIWEEKGYLHATAITRLRDAYSQASDKDVGTRMRISPEALKIAQETTYTIPPYHGDPSTVWNHLPATSLTQAALNPARPVRRDHVRPVLLTAGPAHETLTKLVKSTILDAEALFQKVDVRVKTDLDFSLMGEAHHHGNLPEHVANVDTYWGWSRPVCRRTKDRRRMATSKPEPTQRSCSRSKSRSRLSSAHRSHRSPKRPNYSSRSQSRGRSRSPLHRRSASGHRRRDSRQDRQRSISYSRSRSRSRSPSPPRGRSDRRRSYSKSPSRDSRSSSPSTARSRSGPPRRHPPPPADTYNEDDRRGPPHPAYPDPCDNSHSPMAAQNHPPVAPLGPRGFSAPPPPPPPPVGYQGIFQPPPPPPPPHPQGWSPNQPGPVAPQMTGSGWNNNYVPPLPGSSPYDAYQYPRGGRGWGSSGGGYRGHARGGYNRGGNGHGGRGGYGPR